MVRKLLLISFFNFLFLSCSNFYLNSNVPSAYLYENYNEILISCTGNGYGQYNQLFPRYYTQGSLLYTFSSDNYFYFMTNVMDTTSLPNNTIELTFTFEKKYINTISFLIGLDEQYYECEDLLKNGIPGYQLTKSGKIINSFSVYCDDELVCNNILQNTAIPINKEISRIRFIFDVNKFVKLTFTNETDLIDKQFNRFKFSINNVKF